MVIHMKYQQKARSKKVESHFNRSILKHHKEQWFTVYYIYFNSRIRLRTSITVERRHPVPKQTIGTFISRAPL